MRCRIVANPDDPSDGLTVAQLPTAPQTLNLSVEVFEIRDVSKLDALSAEVERAHVHALFVAPGPTFFYRRSPQWPHACGCPPFTAVFH
jgi:hypothetical protein